MLPVKRLMFRVRAGTFCVVVSSGPNDGCAATLGEMRCFHSKWVEAGSKAEDAVEDFET